jgi:hypothetical protein
MKKFQFCSILVILLVFSFNCLSQTLLPTKESKKFNWEESKQGKTFDVSFKYALKEVEIPSERLNSIVMRAIINSKYQLKNTLSFRPIEVMIYANKDELNISVEYSGKNSFGVESLSRSYFTFKNEGDGSIQLIGTF